jgi:hypothetical protein
MFTLMAVLWTMLATSTPELPDLGWVKGTVRSAAGGQLLPLSEIFVYPADPAVNMRFIRSSSGEFTIVEIPPGIYSFLVSLTGHRATVARQVEVGAGKLTQLDFVLQPITTRNDSTDVVRPGKPGVDYKMRYMPLPRQQEH